MIETLTLPFQLPFLRDALIAALLVAVPCGLLSAFLVLKGWSLIGDAISHAVLPGVVLAYVLGLPLIIGAFVAGMGSALLTGWLDTHSRVKRDTLMGVVFAGMFAVGLVAITWIAPEVHLDHILFGNLLGISAAELWTAGTIAAVILAIMGLRWRDFLLHAFDPTQARAAGLRVKWLHNGLLAMISAAVVSALGAVGIILVIALLVTPGATAFLVTRRFGAMLLASVGVAAASAIGGLYLSIALDSAPAATIVVVLTGFFLAALAWRSSKRALHPAAGRKD
ncbi:membrane protein [Jannaschia pagri]|uniref:Membrane protein n=1 Tax=Jannaschia pagri TaxID=2829797 RepID=A0ABQ4NQH2_9RHOB|nr:MULTISPECIES: metal ABC transporter permease [unclassified Jannaschia]GIT92492.1 membrane protein [Jannaschia sp. AI_61]GIT96327.1 membrane protein [Jannaschia sp. AI_62]